MNSRQMEYAVALSKVRNFSQVSEQLNISQPALSKQIQSLEKTLGVRIFDRNSTPLELTPAGACFIREAEALLEREKQLMQAMEQFAAGDRGRLTIGVSPFRNLHMMPPVVRKIQEAYPGIQVILRETGSDQLRKEAAEGKFDFAIVNLPVDETVLDVIPLEPEQPVLAVPAHMAEKLSWDRQAERPEIAFADCAQLPFITVAQGQEMRRLFDNLCARTGVSPRIALEVAGGITSAWSMACGGIGATILPLSLAREQAFDGGLKLFVLKDSTYVRQPVIVTRSGRVLSEQAAYAISLLRG